MSAPGPTPDELAALRQLDACSLANAIEPFQARLRNEGFMDGSIRSLFPGLEPMAGYAATLKIRAGSPPTEGGVYAERTDWWDYLLSVPAPRILVVQDVGRQPGLGALLGEVHCNILRALGAVGAVTNGSVRDLGAVEKLRFPLFAGSVSVSHSYVHIVEFGGPVEVGGLGVHSGDLLHGDRHGVQSVPPAIAAKLPAAAARQAARDHRVIAACRAPGFSLAKLRAVLAEKSS